MDEFGQRPPSDQDGSGQQEKTPDVVPPTMHEVQKPPSSILPTPGFDRQRIAPFADLPQHQEEKEISDGCCSKCIIM